MRFSDLMEVKTTFFHGSRSEISKFSFDFISNDGGRKLEGPGIYFTSDKTDANVYGSFVHEVVLDLRKTKLLPVKKTFSIQDVKNLIMKSPNADDYLTDWAENPQKALQVAAKSIYDSYGPNQYKEMVTQVWADFYKYEDKDWLKEMVALGYDGLMVERAGGIRHFICYNPDIIKGVSLLNNEDHGLS